MGIEYHCIIDLAKSLNSNGEYHDVYEQVGFETVNLGKIFIKNYTDEEIEEAKEEERLEQQAWDMDKDIYEEEFKQY